MGDDCWSVYTHMWGFTLWHEEIECFQLTGERPGTHLYFKIAQELFSVAYCKHWEQKVGEESSTLQWDIKGKQPHKLHFHLAFREWVFLWASHINSYTWLLSRDTEKPEGNPKDRHPGRAPAVYKKTLTNIAEDTCKDVSPTREREKESKKWKNNNKAGTKF